MTAFVIWFLHFMLCWAAVEIWPNPPRANRLAWVFTVVALVAMAVHYLRLERWHEHSELNEFSRRFSRGAIAIATLAVMFTALPSVMHLP